MKTNILVAAIAAVLFPASVFAQPQPQPRPQMPMPDYKFTVVKENPITSIKNQASSSTCWCFSAIAYLESEIIRIKGIKDPAQYPDLSEIDLCFGLRGNKSINMPLKTTSYGEKTIPMPRPSISVTKSATNSCPSSTNSTPRLGKVCTNPWSILHQRMSYVENC